MKKNKIALALALSLSVTTVCAVEMPVKAASQDICKDLMNKCAEMRTTTEDQASKLSSIYDEVQTGQRTSSEVYCEVNGIVNDYVDTMFSFKEEIESTSQDLTGVSVDIATISKYVDSNTDYWIPVWGRSRYSYLQEDTLKDTTCVDEYLELKAAYEADANQDNYEKLVCKMAELAERIKYEQWEGMNYSCKKPFDVTTTYDAASNVVTTQAHMNHEYFDLIKLNRDHVIDVIKFSKNIVRTYKVEGENLDSLRITQNEKQYTCLDDSHDTPGIAMYTESDDYVMNNEMSLDIIGEPIVNEDGTLTIQIDGDPNVEGDEITANFYEYWGGTFKGSASISELDSYVAQTLSKDDMIKVVEEYDAIINYFVENSHIEELAKKHIDMFINQNNEELRQPVLDQKEQCDKTKSTNDYYKLAKEMITYMYKSEHFGDDSQNADNLKFTLVNRYLGVILVQLNNSDIMKYYRYTMGDTNQMKVYNISGIYASENNAVQYEIGGTRVYVNEGKNWHNVIGTPVINEDGSITIIYKEYLRLKRVTVKPVEQELYFWDGFHDNLNEDTVFFYLEGANNVTYIDNFGHSRECKVISVEKNGYSATVKFNYKGMEIENSFKGSYSFSPLPNDFTMEDILN